MEFVSRQDDVSHLELILRTMNLSRKESRRYGILSQDGENRLNYMNDKAAEIFGFSPEEMLGKPYSVLMPEDCSKQHRHFIRLALQIGQVRDNAAIRYRKEGMRIKIDESIARIKPNGTIYGVAYKINLCSLQ